MISASRCRHFRTSHLPARDGTSCHPGCAAWLGPSAGLREHGMRCSSTRRRSRSALSARRHGGEVTPISPSVSLSRTPPASLPVPFPDMFDATSDGAAAEINVEVRLRWTPKLIFVPVPARSNARERAAVSPRRRPGVCEWLNATRPDVEGKAACLQAWRARIWPSPDQDSIRSGCRLGPPQFEPARRRRAVNEGVTLASVGRVMRSRPAGARSLPFQPRPQCDRSPVRRREYGRAWQQGQVDRMLHGKPHTVLLVTLHKTSAMASDLPHYAEPSSRSRAFPWGEPNQTSPDDKRTHNAQAQRRHASLVCALPRQSAPTHQVELRYCTAACRLRKAPRRKPNACLAQAKGKAATETSTEPE